MNKSGNERYLITSNNCVSDEDIKSLKARVWPKDTVVFAKVGAALLTEKRRILVQDTIFDNNIMGLVPGDAIDAYFLFLLMEIVKLGDFAQPGAVPSVNNSIVSKLEIDLPPIAEQRRIVDLMSSVDSYITALQQQADAARSARSAVLSELLSVGGDGWTETTLGKVAHWQGGITPSMANRSFWEGGTIPWISSGDVLQLSQYGAGKYVTEASLRETSLKLLPIGTIVVVVRSGILAHTLPIALLDTPSTINQDIKAGLPQSGVLGEFLMWFLRSNSQSILESCRKTGTTVQSVSTDAFLRFQVSLPPTKEQERIVEIMNSMDELIQSADKAVADAKSLRSGLLSDLLSGSHEIPESYDRLLGAA